MKPDILYSEFDRQLDNLLQIGYPKTAGFTKKEFTNLVKPLRKKIKSSTFSIDIEKGTLPFVIVVSSKLVSTDFSMTHTSKDGKNGIVKLYPHKSTDFQPIKEVTIPQNEVYLILDIDRGRGNINLPPSEALKLIRKKNRSPLTIDEGVAIITYYPDFLFKNNCFSLLASRHSGDKRVPAIWINSNKQPNLGWCWEGNPHTWLGSASCFDRVVYTTTPVG